MTEGRHRLIRSTYLLERRVKRLFGAVVCALLGGLSLGVGLATADDAGTTAAHTVRTADTSAADNNPGGSVKPIIRGLIDRQHAPSSSMQQFVRAYVVKTTWAALQPSANGPIADDNAIDQAIERVRQPDYEALGMVLKLRVMGGVNAPAWAKSLGGAPVPYTDTQDDAQPGLTIGRFWTQPYEDAYAKLQALLAAKYDNVPEIRELTVSGCTTIFDEPFARQPGYPANVTHLKAAGYTLDADKDCISQAIIAHEVWKHTTTDLDVSPLPNAIDPHAPHDLAFTESMMQLCREQLGVRCGLQNNGLASSKLSSEKFTALYAAMAASGSPIVLQTAAVGRIGNRDAALDYAISMGANSIELPVGYQDWPQSTLLSVNSKLEANPAR